jgi:hypothetical protein
MILAPGALMSRRMPCRPNLLLNGDIIAGVSQPPMARGIRGLIFQLRSGRCRSGAPVE